MRYFVILFAATFFSTFFTSNTHASWDLPYSLRIKLQTTIPANTPATLEHHLDLHQLLKDNGVITTKFDLLVVETDDSNNITNPTVPFQYNPSNLPNLQLNPTLIIYAQTSTSTNRTFYLYLNTNNVQLSSTDFTLSMNEQDVSGQSSIIISSPTGKYSYHKQGAGFASLHDNNDNDWISYNTTTGAKGVFRGLPNMGYPEGYMHPGKTESESNITMSGPVHYRIHSTSNDTKWSGYWDIFPTHARMTVTKVSHNYWFLYEGTPGGILDLNDTITRSSGETDKLSSSWTTDIQNNSDSGEWAIVDSQNSPQSLFLLHHTDDNFTDSYRQMHQAMTVFGFGRQDLQKHMSKTPDHFSIGFIPDSANVENYMSTIANPPQITLGQLESKDGAASNNLDLNQDNLINIFDLTYLFHHFTSPNCQNIISVDSNCGLDFADLTTWKASWK